MSQSAGTNDYDHRWRDSEISGCRLGTIIET